jgi:hypothetical protein
MKKNYISRAVVLLLLILLILPACQIPKFGPTIWYTRGSTGYIQSLVVVDNGPPPLKNTLCDYDLVDGIAAGGGWAVIAWYLIQRLPENLKSDLIRYNPAENKNGSLTYYTVIFDGKKQNITKMQINEDDRLHQKCMLESKKELLTNFRDWVRTNAADHCLNIYRTRFEGSTLFLDIGPYTDENWYAGFGNFIEMSIGFRYSDSDRVFYGTGNIKNFRIEDSVANFYRDTLKLGDVSAADPVDFTYISLPYAITLKEGPPRCEIKDNNISITRDFKKSIIVVARVIVKYHEYGRSVRLSSLGEEWIAKDKARSNIKDLDAPLVELYLETAEIK